MAPLAATKERNSCSGLLSLVVVNEALAVPACNSRRCGRADAAAEDTHSSRAHAAARRAATGVRHMGEAGGEG